MLPEPMQDGGKFFGRLPLQLTRLQLRLLSSADLHEFQAYRSDPLVARFQGWSPMSDEEATAFLREEAAHRKLRPGAWHQLGIALPLGCGASSASPLVGSASSASLLVGDIGLWLSPDASEAEFGVTLARGHQGLGYAREALGGLLDLLDATTGVLKLHARTDSRNSACLALLVKLGMRHVGSATEVYKGETCIDELFCLPRPPTRC